MESGPDLDSDLPKERNLVRLCVVRNPRNLVMIVIIIIIITMMMMMMIFFVVNAHTKKAQLENSSNLAQLNHSNSLICEYSEWFCVRQGCNS